MPLLFCMVAYDEPCVPETAWPMILRASVAEICVYAASSAFVSSALGRTDRFGVIYRFSAILKRVFAIDDVVGKRAHESFPALLLS